jgi:hypothetical protein
MGCRHTYWSGRMRLDGELDSPTTSGTKGVRLVLHDLTRAAPMASDVN